MSMFVIIFIHIVNNERNFSEKGLFAPDKWFDHTFAHDTHKSVAAGRKKILNRGEEELGLSPQRRQFAGGCVPGSTHKTGIYKSSN